MHLNHVCMRCVLELMIRLSSFLLSLRHLLHTGGVRLAKDWSDELEDDSFCVYVIRIIDFITRPSFISSTNSGIVQRLGYSAFNRSLD